MHHTNSFHRARRAANPACIEKNQKNMFAENVLHRFDNRGNSGLKPSQPGSGSPGMFISSNLYIFDL